MSVIVFEFIKWERCVVCGVFLQKVFVQLIDAAHLGINRLNRWMNEWMNDWIMDKGVWVYKNKKWFYNIE